MTEREKTIKEINKILINSDEELAEILLIAISSAQTEGSEQEQE